MRAQQSHYSPLKAKILMDNNRVLKRQASDAFRSDPAQHIPELSLRTYTSLESTDGNHFRKKSSKPSNLTGLLDDFEQLRQNIKKMQTSNQRIVDKIQRNYDAPRFTAGIMSKSETPLPAADLGYPTGGPGVTASGTNYRYEVEEVHQLEGLDEAYQINYLENKVKDLNKRLEEEIGSASYYKFQVWMMKDLLRKNGIQPSEQTDRQSQPPRSAPPPDSSQLLKSTTALLEQQLNHFVQHFMMPKLSRLEQKCQLQNSRLGNLLNTVDVQLHLKCSHMKTKHKFNQEVPGKKKLEMEIEEREGKIKELQRNYQSKSDQLMTFRDQVGTYLEKIRADNDSKTDKLEISLKELQDRNKELNEKLKKTSEQQRKSSKIREQADRLNRLVDELNTQLELNNERLIEKDSKIALLQDSLQSKEKINKTLEQQLKMVKQQLQQQLQKKKSKLSEGMDWLPMQSSVIQHLQSSQYIHQMVDKATATQFLSDPLVGRLTQRVAQLQTQLSSYRMHNSQLDKLTKKLQLSQQNNSKLKQQLERARGDADRKMYKSVLNVQSKIQVTEPGRDTRLQSRIPKSKRYTSILREDSVFNTWSKMSGGKEISLNLSVDEDNPPLDINIEEMITQLDYPFEKLRLTSGDALFVIMKMAQLVRVQRDQIRDKTRLLHFLRTRTDPNASGVVEPVLEDDRIQMCDYGDTYSDNLGFRKNRKKGNQWQQLERESMQAIEKLLEQVEGLQAQLQKAQRNENNLIQMKQLYKGQINKLTRLTEQYQIHYKQQVRRLTQMLQNYQQNKNLDGARELVTQIVRICHQEPQQLPSEQFKGYIHMLGEIIGIKE